MNLDWQDIVIFGLEGGKLKLMGKVIEDGGWVFKKASNECATVDMLENEDLTELAVQESRHHTMDLKKALELASPIWMNLYPLYIHEDFKLVIWKEFIKPNERKVNRLHKWERLCSIEEF
ncbi:hypothetical protein [Guptibacillus hwajinpoensis]|uniref:hypothetical protein n=1 Tax=Guptibacillus hwajinpoensis TaxID=208199 RepID=UPI003D004888